MRARAMEIERSGATRGAQRERRDGHGRGSHQSKEQPVAARKAAESSKPREEKRSSGEEKRGRGPGDEGRARCAHVSGGEGGRR